MYMYVCTYIIHTYMYMYITFYVVNVRKQTD